MSSNPLREESSLIGACVKGQPDAWNSFMGRYDHLIRTTVGICYTKWHTGCDERDDIIGYVYEKLLEQDCHRLATWRGRSSFSTYLVQVVKNLSIDCLRTHARYNERHRQMTEEEIQRLIEDTGRQAIAAAKAEELAQLRSAIDALPPKQALIMVLRLEGKSLRDIAKILKLPQGTVFGENSRAIEALRKKLDPAAFDMREDGVPEENQ